MYFVQWKLSITRSLGPRQFVLYIRFFFYISSHFSQTIHNKGNKFIGTGEIWLLYHYQIFCYISDLFISSITENKFTILYRGNCISFVSLVTNPLEFCSNVLIFFLRHSFCCIVTMIWRCVNLIHVMYLFL